MKIAGGTFAWPGASVAVTDATSMTLLLPAGRYEQLMEALRAPPKPIVPFSPPSGLSTSLDLYEAWQKHEGRSEDEYAWVRNAGLAGVPLTERVTAAFPAFAEMGAAGFYNALHVTMEDGNLDDDNVEQAVALAAEEGDIEAYALALKLRAMTEDERIALYCSLSPYGEQEF